MLTGLRRELRLLRDAPPGRRFIRRYKRLRARKQPAVVRTLRIGASALVAGAGAVMLVVPGPGSLVIVLGLAMLAGEFRSASELMDRAELRLRKVAAAALRTWSRTSRAARAASVLLALLTLTALGFLAYTVLIG